MHACICEHVTETENEITYVTNSKLRIGQKRNLQCMLSGLFSAVVTTVHI